MMGVQPSMVTHWKVVSIASMMLSKLVMPEFGPVHFSRQMDSLVLRRNSMGRWRRWWGPLVYQEVWCKRGFLALQDILGHSVGRPPENGIQRFPDQLMAALQ